MSNIITTLAVVVQSHLFKIRIETLTMLNIIHLGFIAAGTTVLYTLHKANRVDKVYNEWYKWTV
jgi:hypothetical protein